MSDGLIKANLNYGLSGAGDGRDFGIEIGQDTTKALDTKNSRK